MGDSVIEEAKKLRDRLLECAKEFRLVGSMRGTSAGGKMAEFDANACEDAAAMIAKLGTEVDRLRQGIGCFFYTGEPDRIALNRMTKNWNDDV